MEQAVQLKLINSFLWKSLTKRHCIEYHENFDKGRIIVSPPSDLFGGSITAGTGVGYGSIEITGMTIPDDFSSFSFKVAVPALSGNDELKSQGFFNGFSQPLPDTIYSDDSTTLALDDSTTISAKKPQFALQKITICSGEEYFAGGQYQTASGTYDDSLNTIDGCDSIIITELTVLPKYVDSLSIEACANEDYAIAGIQRYSSGIYSDSLKTLDGCDSILTVELTILPVEEDTQIVGICNGQTYFAGGAWRNSPGFYTDTLTTINGCDSILYTDLYLKPSPFVYLGDDLQLCQIDLTLDAGEAEEYLWQDGSIERTFYVNKPGIYSVQITGENRCTASDEIIITERCPMILNVPTAFSPNGNGVNDGFAAKGVNIDEFEIIVFNRWGEELFRSNDLAKKWDGTYKGEPCQEGAYLWIINYSGANENLQSERRHVNGTVTLLR